MSIELQRTTASVLRPKEELIGSCESTQVIRAFAQRVAPLEDIVFLRGETGCGKDHLAEYIHSLGRSRHPFVPVDCGAMQETLCENELFGHAEGAFTDARGAKIGLIKAAEHGTLFLNEVANMSWALQAKLLRVLETRTFRPVGEIRELSMSTRIIAATNANVEQLVREGKLRRDLYYRLNVITFTIPPLRQRREDVLELAEYFLGLNPRGDGKQISFRAREFLLQYLWPGNIRELQNAIERGIFSADDQVLIEPEHLELDANSDGLPEEAIEEVEHIANNGFTGGVLHNNGTFPIWAEVELRVQTQYIKALLKRADFNQSTAAKMANITRGCLREWMRKCDIKIGNQIQ